MEPREVCSPQNITVSCTYMHIWTLQPVRVSSFLHGSSFTLPYFFFFSFFFVVVFFSSLFFSSFFAFEIYKNRLCTIRRSHSVRIHLCDKQLSSHENKLFKEKLFKAPFILWKGTHGKVTEINIPTPLGPLSCLFVRLFVFCCCCCFFVLLLLFYFFNLLNSLCVLHFF